MALLDFDKISTESYTGSTLSMEDIDPQLNDKEIEAALDVFKEIKEKFDSDKEYVLFNLFKQDKKLIEKLENILSNRFGIRIELIGSSANTYFSVFIGPKQNNGLFNFKDAYRDMEGWRLEEGEQRSEYKTKLGFKETKTLITDVLKSFDSIDNCLYHKGITIDLKKAKLSGISNDVKAVINLDFEHAYRYMRIEPRELMGVTLHEIGHVFSYFANSYKSYTTYISLQDSLRELGKKGTDVKKALILSYSKATGDSVGAKEMEKQDTVSVFVGTLSRLFGKFGRDGTTGGITTTETLADMFTTRFGYGLETASGLKKLWDCYRVSIPIVSIGALGIMVWSIWKSIVMGTFAMTGIGLVIVLAMALASILFKMLDIYLVDKHALYEYENDVRRLQYIKNNLVYLIRNTDKKDQVIVNKINNDIKGVEELMSLVSEHSGVLESVSRAVARVVSSGYRQHREKVNLHYELEKLIYNDVHVANSNLNEYLLKNKG